MSFLFSNQYRLIKAAAGAVLLAVMIWWGLGKAMEEEITYAEALQNPAKYLGQTFCFGGRIIQKNNTTAVIKDRGMKIVVSIPTGGSYGVSAWEKVPVGKVVSGKGIFTTGSTLYATAFHYHRFRDIKVVISLVVAAIISVWFVRKFGWDWGKMGFVERD
ncbi:hypothetical protein B5M47_03040 [candidate division CPR3 bacterium 4484_211]|uniref:Uncharacterized protein n=1 Tax=candidate division CPR3 bacterium 4484_211 TaxID=1968527 RepID=A0A1W9NXP7_UNCC3|nr:MAG: hypothetical protein B5M47_03040 [candidate division CPR3 bacterium 4484_211]